MSQPLPTADFRWISAAQESLDPEILNLSDEAEVGFMNEVDLDYPSNIHDVHNAYPLVPERLTIDEIMLSPLQQTFSKH